MTRFSHAIRMLALGAVWPLASLSVDCAHAFDPGVTDDTILIGQTIPYSGPASATGAYGRAQAAYFDMVNASGGINGRRIKFLTLDDEYSPPRTVQQTRKLVEHEGVFALFFPVGTPTQTAVIRYINDAKVPHLFVGANASKLRDPVAYPWSIGYGPRYSTEAGIYARYVLRELPGAKIAVLYQNDDFGKDYLAGLKAGLGARARDMVVAEASYEVTDPTVDSQILTLKAAQADVVFYFATPKFATLAIRKVSDVDWHPMQFLPIASASVGAVLEPVGLQKTVGIISANFIKDPTDPQWSSDRDVRDYLAWLTKWYPAGNPADAYLVHGYVSASALVHVLRTCGRDMTRANVMQRVRNLKDVDLPMLLPGIRMTTTPSDPNPIKQLQLARFDGRRWVPVGGLAEP